MKASRALAAVSYICWAIAVVSAGLAVFAWVAGSHSALAADRS